MTVSPEKIAEMRHWDRDELAAKVVSLEGEIDTLRSQLSGITDETSSAHPDDLAVDRFAAAMKTKLAQKRAEGRGGWDRKDECTAEFLSELLRGHVEKGEPVDVGNFAMMLHQRGETILPGHVLGALRGVIAAWEATKAGETTPREIQRWLVEDMKPAIDEARSAVGAHP